MKTRMTSLFFTLLIVSNSAFAASGGSDWAVPLKTFIQTALEGEIGIIIGLCGLLYGAFAGVRQGSLAGMGTGFGLAAGSFYGPDLVANMSTATLMMI